MKIHIYQDYIHNNGILYHHLCRYYGYDNVIFIDADDIINDILENTPKILFMPGGADLYNCEKLNGIANKKIRKYVEKGGKYIGICAGAYFACSSLDWASKWENEDTIKGKRELSFYSGQAIGPIDEYCDFTKSFPDSYNSSTCLIEYKYNNKIIKTKLHYIGGPKFTEPDPKDKNTKILARYTDIKNSPPAIIKCNIKKGTAILCGPHIEDNSEYLKKVAYRHNNSYNHFHKIAKELETYKKQIDIIWKTILEINVNE